MPSINGHSDYLQTRIVSRCGRLVTLLVGILLLSACGGGGGGDGTLLGSSSVTLAPNQLSQVSLATDSAPSLSTTVTVINPPVGGIYVHAEATNNGLQQVQLGTQIGSSATINFYLKSPATLGPGKYTDTIKFSFCYDQACGTQVSGSPQTVTITYTVNLPDPVLDQLSGTTIYAGSPAFTLSLYGTQFAPQSVGLWNGSVRPTTYVSPTTLNVLISAADLAVSGTESVSVSNAPGGGGISKALPFQIQPESIGDVFPNNAYAGSPGPQLALSGAGFWPTTVAQWNGSNRPTTYVSERQLTVQLTATDIAVAGSYPVTLLSGAGEISAPQPFVVMPIGSLSLDSAAPVNVTAGGSPYTMVLTGAGFTVQSIATWNATPLYTRYVSQSQLLATVPAAKIASTGTASVAVITGSASTSSVLVHIKAPIKDAVAFQINPAHSGTIAFNNVGLPTGKKWTTDVGGAPSYALIASGKVYVTVSVGSNSRLIALNQNTGAMDWGPVSLTGVANATYDSGSVLVLSAPPVGTGVMQAYDPATGTLSWTSTYAVQSYFTAAPTALNGQVFTTGRGQGGTLWSYSVATGRQKWGSLVFYGDASSPAITADGVYVSYPCSTYDYQPFTGALVWSSLSPCGAVGGATPVVANGVLYSPNGTATYSGTTFDAQTGSVLGSYVADNPPAISAVTGFFLQSGTLRAISLASNTINWSFAGDGALVTSPIVVNNYVFIGSSNGNIYALDQATGQVLWQDNVGSAIPPGAGWNAGMPMSGLSAGDGLLIVPGSTKVTAYVLSTNP